MSMKRGRGSALLDVGAEPEMEDHAMGDQAGGSQPSQGRASKRGRRTRPEPMDPAAGSVGVTVDHQDATAGPSSMTTVPQQAQSECLESLACFSRLSQ